MLADPTGVLGTQSQSSLDISMWPGQSAYFAELWTEAAQAAYGDPDALPQDRERARMALRYLCRQVRASKSDPAA